MKRLVTFLHADALTDYTLITFGVISHFTALILNVGIEIAQKLCQRFPNLGIVFLSAYIDRGPEIIQLFLEGHDRINYLLKGSKPAELLEAIQKVARGASALEIASGVQTARKTAFDLALKALEADEQNYLLVALAALPSLSEPERLVFECVGHCHSRQQAAQILNLSVKTISNHMDAIYTKLHLREGDPPLNQLALLAKIHLLTHLKQCAHEQTTPVHEELA